MGVGIVENNFKLIEKSLEKLESIISSRFVLDRGENIEEIHVVSNGRRSAKQLSRDIQSILIATYDIEVDYKKISIAEVKGMDLTKNHNRLKVEGVSYENNGQKAAVTVSLSSGENVYSYSDIGLNTPRNIDRMLVTATLKNIENALEVEDVFILEDIKSVQLSMDKVVLVVVMCITSGEEKRMCGSCIVKNDYRQSVVKATLDAINRCVLK